MYHWIVYNCCIGWVDVVLAAPRAKASVFGRLAAEAQGKTAGSEACTAITVLNHCSMANDTVARAESSVAAAASGRVPAARDAGVSDPFLVEVREPLRA